MGKRYDKRKKYDGNIAMPTTNQILSIMRGITLDIVAY
jgi:hypothetical protein